MMAEPNMGSWHIYSYITGSNVSNIFKITKAPRAFIFAPGQFSFYGMSVFRRL